MCENLSGRIVCSLHVHAEIISRGEEERERQKAGRLTRLTSGWLPCEISSNRWKTSPRLVQAALRHPAIFSALKHCEELSGSHGQRLLRRSSCFLFFFQNNQDSVAKKTGVSFGRTDNASVDARARAGRRARHVSSHRSLWSLNHATMVLNRRI